MTLLEINTIKECIDKAKGANKLITDMDKYQPISQMTDNEDFNWDLKGNNLLDKWCELEQKFTTSMSDVWKELYGTD